MIDAKCKTFCVLVMLASVAGRRLHTNGNRIQVDLSELDDEDNIVVGSEVEILTGKYMTRRADVDNIVVGCKGTVLKLNKAGTKAKVERSCPEGPLYKGNGKKWWYKLDQILTLEDEEIDEDAEVVLYKLAPPAEVHGEPVVQTWDISINRNDAFLEDHPLCDRYADVNPIHPEATPPKLGNRVVVRRGAVFQTKLKGSEKVQPIEVAPRLQVIYLAAPPGVPEDVPDSSYGFLSTEDDTYVFNVNIGEHAPIGEYELRAVSGDMQTLASIRVIAIFNPFSCRTCSEYVGNSELREHFLQEYVGGDEGLLWQGLSDDHAAEVWSFEPFRAANLLISLHLLQDLPLSARGNPTLVSRHLTLVIGGSVCYGKWGGGSYTTGTPDSGYKCRSRKWLKKKKNRPYWAQACVDPSEWTSSSPILEQYWALAQLNPEHSAVQFCQCFVFAGVTTTVGRSLGLGTRPVTNFQSAHDTSHDRSISKFYVVQPSGAWDAVEDIAEMCPDWCSSENEATKNGCDLLSCADEIRLGTGFSGKPSCAACISCVACKSSDDSVWSFHVWNEIYFSRTDMTGANGWQAIDSTPQEESNGEYRMGPASLSKVKKGEGTCFDTEFVISEVNADVKLFAFGSGTSAFQLSDGEPLLYNTRFSSDPFEDHYNTIGYRQVTKAPGPIPSECRENSDHCESVALDVTGNYKKCANEAQGGSACGAGGTQAHLDCKEVSHEPSLVQVSPSVKVDAQLHGSRAVQQTGNESMHRLSAKQTSGDVTAEFSTFLPAGAVIVDEALPVKVTFKSNSGSARTVHVLLSITACDYRGVAVAGMTTRSKKYSSRIPLLKSGYATELSRKIELLPTSSGTFEHTVETGLQVDSLGRLEIETNGFLQFHFSATVAETNQTFSHEPRRRLLAAVGSKAV